MFGFLRWLGKKEADDWKTDGFGFAAYNDRDLPKLTVEANYALTNGRWCRSEIRMMVVRGLRSMGPQEAHEWVQKVEFVYREQTEAGWWIEAYAQVKDLPNAEVVRYLPTRVVFFDPSKPRGPEVPAAFKDW